MGAVCTSAKLMSKNRCSLRASRNAIRRCSAVSHTSALWRPRWAGSGLSVSGAESAEMTAATDGTTLVMSRWVKTKRASVHPIEVDDGVHMARVLEPPACRRAAPLEQLEGAAVEAVRGGHVGRQGPGDVGGAPGHPLEKASTGSPCLELAACGPVADDGSIPTRSRSIWCCVSMPACAWAMCASVLGGRLGRWARPLPLPRAQRAPGRVEHQEVAEGGRPRRWQAEPREGAMIDWSVILVAPVPALGLETVGEGSGELVGEHLAAHWRQPGVGAGRHQHRRRRPSCQVSAPKPDRPVRSQAASISG